MILECTNCGLELGSVFVFVDRHTRLCLICAEQRTAAISRHPAGKRIRKAGTSPHNPRNTQNPTGEPIRNLSTSPHNPHNPQNPTQPRTS